MQESDAESNCGDDTDMDVDADATETACLEVREEAVLCQGEVAVCNEEVVENDVREAVAELVVPVQKTSEEAIREAVAEPFVPVEGALQEAVQDRSILSGEGANGDGRAGLSQTGSGTAGRSRTRPGSARVARPASPFGFFRIDEEAEERWRRRRRVGWPEHCVLCGRSNSADASQGVSVRVRSDPDAIQVWVCVECNGESLSDEVPLPVAEKVPLPETEPPAVATELPRCTPFLRAPAAPHARPSPVQLRAGAIGEGAAASV